MKYLASESPNDTPLVRDIKLAVASDERHKIVDRTVSALDSIRANIERDGFHITKEGKRITELGNTDNLGGERAVARSVEARQRAARNNPNNVRARAVVPLLLDKGMTTRQAAEWLNANGFQTSTGKEFSSVQVSRLSRQ